MSGGPAGYAPFAADAPLDGEGKFPDAPPAPVASAPHTEANGRTYSTSELPPLPAPLAEGAELKAPPGEAFKRWGIDQGHAYPIFGPVVDVSATGAVAPPPVHAIPVTGTPHSPDVQASGNTPPPGFAALPDHIQLDGEVPAEAPPAPAPPDTMSGLTPAQLHAKFDNLPMGMQPGLTALSGQGLTAGVGNEIYPLVKSAVTAIAHPIDTYNTGGQNVADAYHQARTNALAQVDYARMQHPDLGPAAEIQGAFMNPLGMEAKGAAGLARVGAMYGMASGFEDNNGSLDDRLGSAGTHGALGLVAAPVIGKVGNAIGQHLGVVAPPAIDPLAHGAAQAAQDLNIALPKFALSDAARASAGALEQTPFGRGPIVAAKQALTATSTAARNKIASDVGTAPETAAMLGDETRNAAVAAVKANRARIGNIYSRAGQAAGNAVVPATQTQAALAEMVAKENEAIGGTKAGNILKGLLDDLKAKGGDITIDGARATRTELRNSLTNDAGVTATNAERLTNQVMDAINRDMHVGLTAAGKAKAIPLYKQADNQWREQLTNEDEVLKPILGKDMDNWGDEVAKKLNADAKGNGTRLARFLSSLPADAANNVRASIIQALGKAGDGAQSAAGDRTSLSILLTNWNQLKGSRRLIFSPETVTALDKLAKVAEVAKQAEALRNHPGTGGVISRLLMAGESGGAMLGFMTGNFKEGGYALALTGLTGVRQYGAAKLLANPGFARKLAATPTNAGVAANYWARPWVQAMAAKSPEIATELRVFQSSLLRAFNDNTASVAAVAQPQGQQSPTPVH